MKKTVAALAASLLATQVVAQESPETGVDATALMQNFNYERAEKFACDPNADKEPCIVAAWQKAAESGKAVVAYHMDPKHPTMNIVFPEGVVVQLERSQQGQKTDYPAPNI